MKTLRGFPNYFILFAAFPSLTLIANNITEDELTVVIRPLILSILFAFTIYFASRFFVKDSAKAGLTTFLFLVLFFSFGQVLQLMDGLKFFGLEVGRIRFLGIVFLLILIFGIGGILHLKTVPAQIDKYLLWVSIFLIGFQVITITSYLIERGLGNSTKWQTNGVKNNNPLTEDSSSDVESKPDIYYIILDSYTRQDVLEDGYQFNNQPFLDELRGMGFYIAECSRSNYQITRLSMPASLNMDYLPNINDQIKPDMPIDKLRLEELIQHSRIRSELATYGYRFITFDFTNKGTMIPDADEVLKMNRSNQYQSIGMSINPFEVMFIKTTAAIALYRLPLGRLHDWIEHNTFPYLERAEVQLFQMQTLPRLAKQSGPKFVYSHLLIPHFPYIFKPNGELQTDPEFFITNVLPLNHKYQAQGYTDQIKFLNNRIPSIIKSIIDNSKQKPIVILQADHGLDMGNRFAILNAYYFPNRLGYEDLYPTISPVNSFRVVLNNYFGTEYPLLPDQSFRSVGTGFSSKKTPERSPYCSMHTQ